MALQLHTTPQEGAEHVCPLPHAPGAVSAVRRCVRTVLAGWNLSQDVADDALLVISELLTNAVVHALPPTALRLSWTWIDGRSALRIEVTDAGPAHPAGQPADELDPDEHGRGIGIVTALSARCGVHIHPGGITRWADLPAA
ncbi:ATP-binding protein [Streptomyces sp. 8N616]|uniref:ATP-binding protein n=1 Tax=Streptomyces sp. 8N616 TaxID=3457414 RepID=UPI003FD20D44